MKHHHYRERTGLIYAFWGLEMSSRVGLPANDFMLYATRDETET